MSENRKFVPWTVGQKDAFALVGIQGEITAMDHDAGTITIAGHTLPTVLGNGVRHISMHPPQDEDCDRHHCDDGDCDHDDCGGDRCDHGDVAELVRVIEAEHDAQLHRGAFRFCREPLCAAAQAVNA